jgi:FkbM family methyltransferase
MKKMISYLLSLGGFRIEKMHPVKVFKRDTRVKVGLFEITMPPINPLITIYCSNPEFSSELGRIVKAVYQKYSGLCVLDIGGNTGDTIAIVKSSCDVPVISIEGDGYAFQYLKRNAAQFNNVMLFNNYLGDVDRKMKVKIENDGWNSTIIADGSSTREIDIKTFDALMSSSGIDLSAYKLMKIDTEGFDTIIMRGAMTYIKNIKPVIYFEYNRDNMKAIGEDGLASLKMLENMGYSRVLFYDDKGRFLLHTGITNIEIIEALHHYANGRDGLIYYYNICIFPAIDTEIASRIVSIEMNLP